MLRFVRTSECKGISRPLGFESPGSAYAASRELSEGVLSVSLARERALATSATYSNTEECGLRVTPWPVPRLWEWVSRVATLRGPGASGTRDWCSGSHATVTCLHTRRVNNTLFSIPRRPYNDQSNCQSDSLELILRLGCASDSSG